MLEFIRMRNFQCHERLEIEFDPRITTLVGRTDAGKSAGVRALRWVALNQPRGTGIIQHGKKTARAEIGIDGRKITRRRGTANTYELDGKKFAAVRNTVPPEILAVVNVESINFQGQHDAPYYLADSPGAVARQLNAIVNLDEIDTTIRNVGAAVRDAAAALAVSRDRLKTARDARRELAWVPEYLGKLGNLEKLQAEIDAKRNRTAALRSVLGAVDSAESAARGVSGAAGAIQRVVAAGDAAQAAWERVSALRGLVAAATRADEEFQDTSLARRLALAKLAAVKRCPLCQNRIA